MKQTLLLCLLISFFITGFAQKKEIPVKNYFADAEYFFVEEEYIDALQDYLVVSGKGFEDNANINYRIGVCYLNIPGQKEKSIDYLLKASGATSDKYSGLSLREEFAPLDALLYLGNAYRVNNKLDKAIEWYSNYMEVLPDQAVDEKKYAKKQIESCLIAKEYLLDPLAIKFTPVGSVINTASSNHNCVVSGDGSTLIYMTKLPFYEAVFMSKKRGSNWGRPVNITPQIMSDGDQFVCDISFDALTLLLVKEDEFDSDIYISTFENGQWTKSKPISKAINSRYWESHASLSKDGNTLYFTSNKPGGVGMVDIYVSYKENKDWSTPKNIGPSVNSELSEDAPFITDDGNSLYFSSQGHTNMGGYDYFVTHKTDSGWTGPENLRYPLSTTDEDVFYYPWNNGESGYVHKMLDGGKGSWDVYMAGMLDEEEVEEALTEQVIEDVDEEQVVQEAIEEIEEAVIEFEAKAMLFGFDAYSLTSESKNEVSKYIELLKQDSELGLKIIGYTDALGPENYNILLSKRRAEAVKKYVVEKGIPENKIQTEGKGEQDFIAKNSNPDGTDNPEGRKYNRRVEIEIIGIDENKILIRKINIVPESLKYQQK